jgi:hypothetical protein
MARGELSLQLDAFDNLGLRLFPEPVQPGDAAFLTGGFQLLHAVDAQFVVKRFDLFGTDARNLYHLGQSGRQRGFQFLVKFQAAGRNELGDFLLELVTDPFDLAQTFLFHHQRQRLSQVFDGTGRVGIGPCFEGVFTLQFQQRANLDQHFCDLFLIHGGDLKSLPRAAKRKVVAATAASHGKVGQGWLALKIEAERPTSQPSTTA